MTVFASKYLLVDWGAYSFRKSAGVRHRKWRHRHNRRAHNHYVQFGPLEITVWYR